MAIILDGTNGAFLPTWTTGTRPASPANGEIGYNSTTAQLDQYVGGAWSSVPTGSAAAATPTALGTVYGKQDTSSYAVIGYQASNSGTASETTAVGVQAMFTNTSGTSNVAMGYSALRQNSTGSNNTAIGSNALYSQTVGNSTAVGNGAFDNATNGGANTALGYKAGSPTTTGSGNTFIGYQTGKVCTTGSANIHLGYNTSTSAAAAANEIVISTNSDTGKGDQTGFIAPGFGSCYQGSNAATWAVTSDRRLKKNIVDNTEGLSKIAQIRVRNFEYRLPEEVEAELKPSDAVRKTGVQLGVIAQELQEVCSDCIKEESTGVLRVDSDNVFWHMVNAIKDLKAIVDAQAVEIADLKAKVA